MYSNLEKGVIWVYNLYWFFIVFNVLNFCYFFVIWYLDVGIILDNKVIIFKYKYDL